LNKGKSLSPCPSPKERGEKITFFGESLKILIFCVFPFQGELEGVLT